MKNLIVIIVLSVIATQWDFVNSRYLPAASVQSRNRYITTNTRRLHNPGSDTRWLQRQQWPLTRYRDTALRARSQHRNNRLAIFPNIQTRHKISVSNDDNDISVKTHRNVHTFMNDIGQPRSNIQRQSVSQSRVVGRPDSMVFHPRLYPRKTVRLTKRKPLHNIFIRTKSGRRIKISHSLGNTNIILNTESLLRRKDSTINSQTKSHDKTSIHERTSTYKKPQEYMTSDNVKIRDKKTDHVKILDSKIETVPVTLQPPDNATGHSGSTNNIVQSETTIAVEPGNGITPTVNIRPMENTANSITNVTTSSESNHALGARNSLTAEMTNKTHTPALTQHTVTKSPTFSSGKFKSEKGNRSHSLSKQLPTDSRTQRPSNSSHGSNSAHIAINSQSESGIPDDATHDQSHQENAAEDIDGNDTGDAPDGQDGTDR